MKFLTRINRNYLLLFSTILIVLSFAGYFILKKIITDNTEEKLLSQEMLIEKQIAETDVLPGLNPLIEVKQTIDSSSSKSGFKEISIFNQAENETEYFIEYSNIIKVNNVFYLVQIREASLESEDLALSIGVSIFILLLAAFSISYIITRRLNKTTWLVFEQNLREIERFDFREERALALQKSDIEEFDRLNLVVNNLTNKLKKDFFALKEFTENASHEIQSPLTIALLNLEEILQQDLSEETMKKVIAAINAIQRLSTLNQNLLLLTRIENNQFPSIDLINFNKLIQLKIQEFDLFLKEKSIQVNVDSESEFIVKMSPHLAGILINNLLSNAVNHNVDKGTVNILLNQNKLQICNTGKTNGLTEESIFNRFVKGNSKSYGLGLSIVKQICDSHQLVIHYSYNEYHCFTITQRS